MQEPKRDEDNAGEPQLVEPQADQAPEFSVEPKAYAFDGWAMVPVEFDLV